MSTIAAASRMNETGQTIETRISLNFRRHETALPYRLLIGVIVSLLQDSTHDVAMHIGQSEVSTSVAVGQPFMV